MAKTEKARQEEFQAHRARRSAELKNLANPGGYKYTYNEMTKRTEKTSRNIRSKDMSKDDRFLGWL